MEGDMIRGFVEDAGVAKVEYVCSIEPVNSVYERRLAWELRRLAWELRRRLAWELRRLAWELRRLAWELRRLAWELRRRLAWRKGIETFLRSDVHNIRHYSNLS